MLNRLPPRSAWIRSKLRRRALSMPRARTSTLSRPTASRSSLSHWITVRSAMLAFSTGTRVSNGCSEMTKPPGCCERWRGKPINSPVRPAPGAGSDSADRSRPLPGVRRWGLVAPAAAAVGQDVDLLGRQTQGLGYVAHRAGAVVGADHRGQRRALASVACENVLDDLLAALVFEIHVDVRWFVALAGKEALEQQVGPVRVQLGDAEGEAHCRIGRRAAALAKDFPAPGEGDDVLHGEEIAFIAQFGDQLEFSRSACGPWRSRRSASAWRCPVR